MNVKELKNILRNVPDDIEVILSSDAEGNSYSPVYTYDVVFFDSDNETVTHPDDFSDEEYEALEKNAFVLWPV